MGNLPSTNGGNGRDYRGRFAKGNGGGPGNPLGGKVAKLRACLIRTVNVADMREIAKNLITRAKAGESDAVTLLFKYTLGQPLEADMIERVEKLEYDAKRSGGTR